MGECCCPRGWRGVLSWHENVLWMTPFSRTMFYWKFQYGFTGENSKMAARIQDGGCLLIKTVQNHTDMQNQLILDTNKLIWHFRGKERWWNNGNTRQKLYTISYQEKVKIELPWKVATICFIHIYHEQNTSSSVCSPHRHFNKSTNKQWSLIIQ